MPFLRRIYDEAREEDRPILRKPAKKMPLEELRDPLTQQLIDDMFLTMYNAPGIGLAAPQVGISRRLAVVDLQDGEPEHGPLVIVNPRYLQTEGQRETTEGCLSVPGMVGELDRFERVVISGLDRHGDKLQIDAEGWFAVCLQHEIDHLDGVLYIDKARNIRPAMTPEEIEAAEAAQAEGAPAAVEQTA